MKYTKKQLQHGMKAYYKNMRDNPQDYDMSPECEFNDQQAVDAVDELISYIEANENTL